MRTNDYYRGAAQMAVAMLGAKFRETGEQAPRCARIAELIGRKMRLTPPQLHNLKWGAYLHDVGKITVPRSIIEKPGKLTQEERAVVQTHAQAGFDILIENGFRGIVALVAAQHHERWDGKGYPEGLAGRSICLQARIHSVADAYDAMVSDRCYRKGRSHEAAVAELKRCAGTQFDPLVVEAFSKISLAELAEVD